MRTIHFPMGDSAANGPVGGPSHGHSVPGHDPAAPGGGPNGGAWTSAPTFMDPLHMDFQFMFNPEAPEHQLFAPPPPPPHDPAAAAADPQAGHPHPHPTPHAQHPPHPHPHPHAHQHQHPPSYAVTQPPSTQSPEGQQPLPNDEEHEDDEQDPENGSATYYPNKPTKKTPPQVDPYAAGFLREVLGLEKWNTFSSRLFERRLVGPRARQKTKGGKTNGAKDDGRDGQWSASVVDFLTKAEAVKEVLRTYVPHPYNPHKTLSHPYVPAPSGRVTLSRSTVLALSGWSNTQFSYWARRSEAISVLGIHDRRLRNVAIALSHRLRGEPLENEAETVNGITGKGLDAIVEEVKDRTGASQFLRGKHSSLDPFGLNDAMTGDVDHRSLHTSPLVAGGPNEAGATGLPGQPPPPQQQHYVSTFDSHGYGPTTTTTNYFSPAMSDARSMSPEHRDQARPMTSTMATAQQLPPGYAIGFPSVAGPPHDPNAAAPADPSQSPQPPQQPPAPTRATNRYPSRAKRASGTAAASANGNAGANGAAKAIKPDSSRREYFPVSDSRSEVEAGAAAPASGTAATGKRKAAAENGPSKKRSRTTVAGGGDA